MSSMPRGTAAGAATLGAIACLVLIERIFVRSGPPADVHVTVPAVLALVAAAAVGAGWPRSRAWLAPTAAGVAFVWLVAALLHRPHVAPREAFWILTGEVVLLLLLSLAVRWAAARDALLASALAAVAGPLTLLRVTDPASTRESVGVVFAWGVVAAGPVALGLYLRVLDARRARMVLQARRAQRLELAHELHDSVAHDVTGMVVQAQGAQVVATRDPGEVLSALRGIEETGLQALGSLDRTVHALRDVPSHDGGPPQDPSVRTETGGDARLFGIEDIFQLVGRFSITDCLPVRLHVDAVTQVAIAPEVSSTAYRVVREALTNVRRHAPESAAVDVRLVRGAGPGSPAMVVSVTNTVEEHGQARRGLPPAGSRPNGLGLVGLAERVEAIGGSFAAGPLEESAPRGWRVTAVLPLRGAGRP